MSNSYLNKIAATPITADLLVRANNAAADLADRAIAEGERPSFEAAMIAILNELGDELEAHQLSAVVFRMNALWALIKRKEVDKWIMDIDGERFILVQEALYKAAAAATLDMSGKPHFDPREFRDLALKFAEPEGDA